MTVFPDCHFLNILVLQHLALQLLALGIEGREPLLPCRLCLEVFLLKQLGLVKEGEFLHLSWQLF